MTSISRCLSSSALALVFILSACTQAALHDVTPEQAAGLTGVTVIDVRTPEEFAQGHIEGAQNIDFYGAAFNETIAQLPRDGPYLIYCGSGKRSGATLETMRSLGFATVYNLEGGVAAWTAAGYPLT